MAKLEPSDMHCLHQHYHIVKNPNEERDVGRRGTSIFTRLIVVTCLLLVSSAIVLTVVLAHRKGWWTRATVPYRAVFNQGTINTQATDSPTAPVVGRGEYNDETEERGPYEI